MNNYFYEIKERLLEVELNPKQVIDNEERIKLVRALVTAISYIHVLERHNSTNPIHSEVLRDIKDCLF